MPQVLIYEYDGEYCQHEQTGHAARMHGVSEFFYSAGGAVLTGHHGKCTGLELVMTTYGGTSGNDTLTNTDATSDTLNRLSGTATITAGAGNDRGSPDPVAAVMAIDRELICNQFGRG